MTIIERAQRKSLRATRIKKRNIALSHLASIKQERSECLYLDEFEELDEVYKSFKKSLNRMHNSFWKNTYERLSDFIWVII